MTDRSDCRIEESVVRIILPRKQLFIIEPMQTIYAPGLMLDLAIAEYASPNALAIARLGA
jgi:hypothetical protein